jgi:hypothetical protein
MTRMPIALAILIATLTIGFVRDAAAQWCAQYDPYTYTCGFVSFNQCMDTVRGVGGACRRDMNAQPPREERRQGAAPRSSRPAKSRECGSISNPDC